MGEKPSANKVPKMESLLRTRSTISVPESRLKKAAGTRLLPLHSASTVGCSICDTSGSESEARRAFAAMKTELAKILEMNPTVDDPEVRERGREVEEAISNFVDRFP